MVSIWGGPPFPASMFATWPKPSPANRESSRAERPGKRNLAFANRSPTNEMSDMNQQLPLTIEVVKQNHSLPIHDPSAIAYNSRVTLAHRIETLLERTGWSARKLSLNAGLSASHVGTILTKSRADPDYSVERKTIEAIALAAGVSPGWLLTGEGEAPSSAFDGVDVAPREPEAPSTFGGYKNYERVEASARLLAPEVPDWAWDATRNAHPMWVGKDPPTAAVIADVARVIMKHRSG